MVFVHSTLKLRIGTKNTRQNLRFFFFFPRVKTRGYKHVVPLGLWFSCLKLHAKPVSFAANAIRGYGFTKYSKLIGGTVISIPLF